MDLDKINVRSDEVQDLMSFIPSSLVRWGMTVFFISFLCALFVSWLIQYPDIIKARIIIVSSPPPIDLIARESGKLSLKFEDQSVVKAGTKLAFIENSANIDDIYALKKQLLTFQNLLKDPHSLTNLVFDKTASLGPLQSTYSEFIQNVISYQLIIKHLADDDSNLMSSYGDRISKLVHDRNILLEESGVAERKLESNKILLDKGMISALRLADYEEDFNKIKTSLKYLDAEIKYAKSNLILTIELQYKKLDSQLTEWENKYAIIAPIDGTISLYDFWSDNQFISIGDTVLTIVPLTSKIYAKLYLPVTGSGKVEKGQTVLIKCDSYPYQEYGYVKGFIETISIMAQNNQYIVNVDLPNNLKTNYKKDLTFKHEMEGEASIITREDRLITRIFHHFRHFFNSTF